MKFIKLKKIECQDTFGCQDTFIAVNAAHIVSIEVCDDESTWIQLVSGVKFLVTDLVDDILAALGATVVQKRKA